MSIHLTNLSFAVQIKQETMWKHVRETHGLPKFVDCPKCQNTIELTLDERHSVSYIYDKLVISLLDL